METPEQNAVNVIQFPAMQSVSVGKLMAALAKAQAKIVAPKKSKTAKVRSKKGDESSYDYNYADLEDTIESIKAPMAEVGLAYYHLTTRMPGDPRTWVVTRIGLADTEEWIQTMLPVAEVGNLQELGGCLTYLQKYNLRMLLGQSGGDRDDDGASVVAGAAEDEEILEERRRATVERLAAEKKLKESSKRNYIPNNATLDPVTGKWLEKPISSAAPVPADSKVPAAPAPAPAPAVIEKPHLAKLRAVLATEGATPEMFMDSTIVVKNIGKGAAWDSLPTDFVGFVLEPATWKKVVENLTPPF